MIGYKVCRPGDLVINTHAMPSMGALGVTRHDRTASARPMRVSPIDGGGCCRLCGSLVANAVHAAESQRRIDGREQLATSAVSGCNFCRAAPYLLPPLEEQAAIVRFLDWANGRLERAIRAKRKVIALLTEQKQAIIHRAVTRGLDPQCPAQALRHPLARRHSAALGSAGASSNCCTGRHRLQHHRAPAQLVDDGQCTLSERLNSSHGELGHRSTSTTVQSRDLHCCECHAACIAAVADVVITGKAQLAKHVCILGRRSYASASASLTSRPDPVPALIRPSCHALRLSPAAWHSSRRRW